MQVVAVGLFLVDLPNLEAVVVGVQIAKVDCITVTVTYTVHELAIVIDSAVTLHDFIKSVAIHVTRRKVMVSLPVAFLAARRRIVVPALRQRFSVPVVGRERHARVIAALENHARFLAIEIGICRKEAVDAVPVTVAPVLYRTAPWIIGDGRHFKSRFAVENREVFVTGQNVSTRIAVIAGMCRIGRCALAQVLSAGILRSRRCLYGKFRLAVAIVVTHEHLRVVRPRTDVYA